MKIVLTRLGHVFIWSCVTLLVMVAVAVTAMRIALPHLNYFQSEIKEWVKHDTGLDISIASVSGVWRNNHPSLLLQGLNSKLPENQAGSMTVDEISVDFDVLQSLMKRKPVVTNLVLDGLNLDIRSVDLFSAEKSDDTDSSKRKSSGNSLVKQLNSLLLRQLEDFTLSNTHIRYKSVSGEDRQLDIERMRWRNQGKHHWAEGTVSIVESKINSLLVSADFIDHGSLLDVSGQFYLSAGDVSVTPWLTKYVQSETGIKAGEVSLNTWLTLEHSKPVSASVELLPSQLEWHDKSTHHLWIDGGVLELTPQGNGWKVGGHSLKFRTDDIKWPDFDVAFDWNPKQWQLNISELDVSALTPLFKMMPDSDTLNDYLHHLAPHGTVEDIRVAMGEDISTLHYSAQVRNFAMQHWKLLPGVNHVQGSIAGDAFNAKARVSVVDDKMPYGNVFQAPLNIRQGETSIVWQRDDSGWRLWSDKITAATPDLQVLGAFRLDFPNQGAPFLSFYAEADLYNAGQTWRYLPTLALGQKLTDYLSMAIQAGKVNTAKLIWYGPLNQFPYHQHNGIFQVWFGLHDARFAFDTAWPPITDLDIDILFENDAMYLDAKSARLNDIQATRITGRIPSLAPDGHLEIEAKAKSNANAVRNYMTATPLVDSVGAALTALQLDGEVDSEFQLNIPFSADKQPRAWGYADLTDNHMDMTAPPMSLEHVNGRINFDNDVVTASGLSAQLLGQPIAVDFHGENATDKGYNVAINALGDWDVKPLAQYVGKKWIDPLSGHVPWGMDVNIQLNDIGFTYQVDLQSKLNYLASNYPKPLNKKMQTPGQGRLQVSGNQQNITARLQLPQAKFQTEIDISGKTPVLTATNLVLGNGGFKISPVVGHHALIRTDDLNLDKWFALLQPEMAQTTQGQSGDNNLHGIQYPLPTRVNLEGKTVTVGGVALHDVNFSARKKNKAWRFDLNSQEAEGEGNYLEPYDLAISLKRLHLYFPGFDLNKKLEKDPRILEQKKTDPPITDFERQFYKEMPNLTLDINDFWLQGYKIGDINVDIQRQKDRLAINKANIHSGANNVDLQGWWKLDGAYSHSKLKMHLKGKNNSDLMDRLGITSDIQKASFDVTSDMQWDGSFWALRVNTLQGSINAKLGKGVVTDVSGAARFLGLFSFDSIIRKMQLDFSDIFDNGMAFNSITGSGKMEGGVFVTNNIHMDALAGDMTLKGMADLNTRTVDAQVQFKPDITSGLPTLAAFAVAPQAALYVLAISTVISPVVEVFTQVNYEVKGPMASPTVKEISRTKGEYTLPKKLREQAKEKSAQE